MATCFTCISCRVAFADSDMQRIHYKSDWHRYNLKRKVAQLPPVTIENFQARVLAHKSIFQESNHESIFLCQHCRKNFTSKNSFENHLKSKKHQEIIRKLAEGGSSPIVVMQEEKAKKLSGKPHLYPKNPKIEEEKLAMDESDDEWEDVENEIEIDTEPMLENKECLFCSENHSSIEDNVKHMTEKHSFFIPDAEYLVDLEGLMSFLAEKISVGKMCLWCNEKGKAFSTIKSVQQHMVDKGHSKIFYEGDALVEYVEFYDYSASYPEAEENPDPDDEVNFNVLDGEDYQLVLPSGSTIGHRSLMKYYRQNIPPTRGSTTKSQRMVQNVLSHYRAIGHSTVSKEMTMKRVQDVRYLQKIRSKKYLQQGVKNNKLQRHTRLQYKIQ